MTTKEAVALLERYSNYDGMGIPNLAGCKEAMRVAVDALKEAYPELAESEDERIRRELLEYAKGEVRSYDNMVSGDYDSRDKEDKMMHKWWQKIVAYLEKQKNLDKMIVVSPEVWDNAISDAYENGKGDSEKQKEQKPWKVGANAYFTPEQNSVEFTHHETNESLKDAVTHQMEDDGDVDDFVRRGIDDIALKYAELGAKWQKEQKPCWNPTEEDVALFNKAITTNASLSPQERAKLDILRMKFKHRPVIEQKEQKPAESISQLTVQGKGVYKICPRCKERMIRDDSMVYTSMPPQYIYECPKCGERECDTVMYDSSVDEKQQEQKPILSDRDLTDFEIEVHEIIAQARNDSRLNDADVLKQFEEEAAFALMLKANKLIEQKPAEWDEYTKTNLDRALQIIKDAKGTLQGYQSDDGIYECDKAIECLEHFLYRGLEIEKPVEWSEEEQKIYDDIISALEKSLNANRCYFTSDDVKFLKFLRPQPHWKPSEEQMKALQNAVALTACDKELARLYNQLKKL